ncbi:MAG: M23 family metallopeptidase [Treponema sp.]|nr:M23 family metallopeptidase [Treponema sp.]
MKVSFFVIRKCFFAALMAFSSVCFCEAKVHTVEKGETFYSISRKYGITVDELCSVNSLTKNDVLKAGQKLSIPSKDDKSAASERKFDVYTVQKGDTLFSIARKNGISVDELKKLNSLDGSSVLKAGDKLKIPATILDTKTASLPELPKATDPRNYSDKKGDSSLVWPVKASEVTYVKGKVSGVQLSAAKNENVTAVRSGTVMYVGNYRGYGQVVFVQSKTGHIYAYSGLGSIKVKKGEYVVFGDVLGTAGIDSLKQKSQILFMVFQKSIPIDPAKAPRG